MSDQYPDAVPCKTCGKQLSRQYTKWWHHIETGSWMCHIYAQPGTPLALHRADPVKFIISEQPN